MAGSSRDDDVRETGEEEDEKWSEEYRRQLRKELREHMIDTQSQCSKIDRYNLFLRVSAVHPSCLT